MKIDLSAQEYLDLLDIIHIADVVMSGHRRTPDDRSARHRVLVQKLYGLSGGEGLERLMTYDKDTRQYVPTGEFEEKSLSHVLLHEFGDHVFWDELIGKLSVRDAAREAGGLEKLEAMNDSDRQALEGPIRLRYIEEFSGNGVANLVLVRHFAAGAAAPARTSD